MFRHLLEISILAIVMWAGLLGTLPLPLIAPQEDTETPVMVITEQVTAEQVATEKELVATKAALQDAAKKLTDLEAKIVTPPIVVTPPQAIAPPQEPVKEEPFTVTQPPAEDTVPAKWRTNIDAAEAESKKSGKPIFIDFTLPKSVCPKCKSMIEVYENKDVAARLFRDYVPLWHLTTDNHALAEEYGITMFPAAVVQMPNGSRRVWEPSTNPYEFQRELTRNSK